MSFIYTLLALVIGFSAGYAYRGAHLRLACGRQARQARQGKPAAPVGAEESQEGREKIQKRIEKRKMRIMELAKKQGRITNDDAEDMFCISDHTARNYLGGLVEEGKLSREGVAGGTYYTPKI